MRTDGTCQRRSSGWTTAYSDAPETSAASRAITSVSRSRDPPCRARKPTRDRSSSSSTTPSWARRSASTRRVVLACAVGRLLDRAQQDVEQGHADEDAEDQAQAGRPDVLDPDRDVRAPPGHHVDGAAV